MLGLDRLRPPPAERPRTSAGFPRTVHLASRRSAREPLQVIGLAVLSGVTDAGNDLNEVGRQLLCVQWGFRSRHNEAQLDAWGVSNACEYRCPTELRRNTHLRAFGLAFDLLPAAACELHEATRLVSNTPSNDVTNGVVMFKCIMVPCAVAQALLAGMASRFFAPAAMCLALGVPRPERQRSLGASSSSAAPLSDLFDEPAAVEVGDEQAGKEMPHVPHPGGGAAAFPEGVCGMHPERASAPHSAGEVGGRPRSHCEGGRRDFLRVQRQRRLRLASLVAHDEAKRIDAAGCVVKLGLGVEGVDSGPPG